MIRWIAGGFLIISAFLLAQTPQASAPSTIRFEDATTKSGIQFTHSFGARDLGTLLDGTAEAVPFPVLWSVTLC